MREKKRTEMTPELIDRIGKVKQKARDWLVKNEIVQFRLDQESYRNLFLIAERERKPIGTLVREWISERIKQDPPINGKGKKVRKTSVSFSELGTTALAKQLNDLDRPIVFFNTPNPPEMATTEQIIALQKQIDELKNQTK